jgi:hypothetical protein
MSDLHSEARGLAERAKDVVGDVKAKGSEITGEVSRVATNIAKDNIAQVQTATRELASKAQNKVEETITQRKSVGADYIGSIAQATEHAAEAFTPDLPQAAHYIRLASKQMQEAADTLRERNVRELIGNVQGFARKQPTLFFGGAMILGFAALRFLKSASPAQNNAPKHEG